MVGGGVSGEIYFLLRNQPIKPILGAKCIISFYHNIILCFNLCFVVICKTSCKNIIILRVDFVYIISLWAHMHITLYYCCIKFLCRNQAIKHFFS